MTAITVPSCSPHYVIRTWDAIPYANQRRIFPDACGAGISACCGAPIGTSGLGDGSVGHSISGQGSGVGVGVGVGGGTGVGDGVFDGVGLGLGVVGLLVVG